MSEMVELVIIGAGPAGLAAAVEAVGFGLHPLLIDTYPQPGGQYFKQAPSEFRTDSTTDEKGKGLLLRLESARVQVLSDTVVWTICPQPDGGFLLALCGPTGTPRRLHARKVILSTGAYDRPVPFPGWTLPGVMTAGAVQVLLKSQRMPPGQRVLLCGTGPLQWAVAHQLIAAGSQVVAVLDANPFPWKAWRYPGALWGQWKRLREGWDYWRSRVRAGVALRWGHTIFRAEGDHQVEQAVIGRVGSRMTEKLEVDTICVGYGLVPSAQLSSISGAKHHYRADTGGYEPVRDERLQTTLPGLFAVGDGAEIGSKDVAMLEGRLAALAALRQLGREVPTSMLSPLRKDLKRQRRFAAMLSKLFPYPASLWDLLTDETILCRCEELTVAEIRQVLAAGVHNPDNIKTLTRVGMGRCQGRMCGGALNRMIAMQRGLKVEHVGYLKPRPPVVPVPIERLLEEEEVSHVS